MKKAEQLIYTLEMSLLTPDIRKSPLQLKELIADEFIEHGSSGTIYDKNDLLNSLPCEEERSYVVENFSVLKLSSKVMLATYRVTCESKSSLRSSIWKFKNARWQMIFHQGTPCP